MSIHDLFRNPLITIERFYNAEVKKKAIEVFYTSIASHTNPNQISIKTSYATLMLYFLSFNSFQTII